MQALRLVVVTVLMGVLCFGLVSGMAQGLRTGRIRYGRGRGERFARRKTQPVWFWSLMVVFALLACASVAAVVWVAHTTLFKS